MIAARGEQALQLAAEELGMNAKSRIQWTTFDAHDDRSVEAMVACTAKRLGGLDIVVNAASTPASVGGPVSALGIDTAELLADLDVKILGYLRVARAAAPFMIANGWGRIINIGGLAVRSTGNYGGSIRNAGVAALTKCLADELAIHGVSVTAVHPGATRTERTPARIATKVVEASVTPQEAEKLLFGHSLLGRIVEAEEVATLVTFLASPLSAAISGDNLFAGGGSKKAINY
jgi:NAD(P)-dependent dehydrogenase (short-subunit alcohol dehydrogenase family)